ncbi:glycosyltransferase family 2 protein [Methylicorpusculum sp.]|uniref:glycosyltransferase family 2 protein n=1 Tax=Methylicorpusculum sp. TaxID=2713644 RepID=UPI00272F3368|nr:glycosyltransferase [Methylicorpusculum sp.]MDP2178138.1 glycosyltransferase [Methylicorpusculum sp.]MDP3531054.1 glycosyltransferase [Methylicorpusculum sp.]MDZ4154532.1 glycosyltransferase [Methylicorpusculum sp.]
MYKKTLLTLVIPAYNVEKYISACIRSVIDQCSCHQVPIVIVIDGATDNTEDELRCVLENYDYNQVTVVTQKNQGLSAARNRGLVEVSTEYVAFLDSDDLWSSDYLDRIIPILQKRHPDILEYNAALISEDGSKLGRLQITCVGEGDLATVKHSDFIAMFHCYAWARVTKTEILRKHLFPVGERFEDAGSVPWHYWSANRIYGLGEPLVLYRKHNNSILATSKPEDIYDLAKSVERASIEYASTRANFWQTVAGRIHQVACGRILFHPLKTWPSFVHILNTAIADTPPNPGILRWLQIKQTYVYLLMLFLKRCSSAWYK